MLCYASLQIISKICVVDKVKAHKILDLRTSFNINVHLYLHIINELLSQSCDRVLMWYAYNINLF